MARSRTPGIARIVVLVGGTCAEMVRYLNSLAADVVLWVDVLTELEKVKPAPGVIRVVLAAGKTLASLFEDLPGGEYAEQARELFESLPGVDMNTGHAQLPAAGIRSADLLVATPEFRAILRDVYSRVMISHNGTIEEVELDLFASLCGGTGGPAGGPIVDEIAKYYREHHRAVVHTRFNRAGSLSFEGCGDGISPNGAAAVFSDLASTLLDPRPLSEVRSLVFYELPMCARAKTVRDGYMATSVQALNCSEFRALRDLSAPNSAAHSALGSISLIDMAWWKALGPERIRLNVAARFREQLLDVLNTEPSRNVLERIEVATTAQSAVSDTTIPQLLDQIHQNKRAEPAGLLDVVENITCSLSAITVYAHYRASGRGEFEDCWRERCQVPCRSTDEFRDRLAFLRALVAAVDAEMRNRTDKIATLQNQRRQTKAALTGVKDEYYPRTIIRKLENWAFADSRRRDRDRRFGSLAKTAREAKLAVDRLEAENSALGLCRDELQKAVHATEKRIRSVLRVLGSEATLNSVAAKPDLVEIADIDSLLEELLHIAEATEVDEQRLADTLLSAAKQATLEGLADMAGAQEPRVDLIAQQLTKQAPKVGPYWGGRRPMSIDSTVFVLPPVAGELRDALLAAYAPLVHHSDKFHLVFADTAEAGFNIVRLQIRVPKSISDIVTPIIADEFEAVTANPVRYFREGTDLDRMKSLLNGHHNKRAIPTAPR